MWVKRAISIPFVCGLPADFAVRYGCGFFGLFIPGIPNFAPQGGSVDKLDPESALNVPRVSKLFLVTELDKTVGELVQSFRQSSFR